ncbi:MAG: hypothetical protein ACW99U_19695 [Candidatus Thorarchaeota archaeon]|jgi:hypothetical protein
MANWIHTTWANQEHITKFIDKNDCWWHRWSAKLRSGRRKLAAAVGYERGREWGRRPYIDGSNWGIKSHTERRSRRLAQERPITQERRRRGKKI